MSEEIPESPATRFAISDVFSALQGEVGDPARVTFAIKGLIEAKIADAVEYAADHVAEQVAAEVSAIRSSHE